MRLRVSAKFQNCSYFNIDIIEILELFIDVNKQF